MSYIDPALSANLERLHYTANPILPRSQAQEALRSFTCWCHRTPQWQRCSHPAWQEQPVSLNPFPSLPGLYILSLLHLISHCIAEQALLSAHGNPAWITDTEGSYCALLFRELDATTSPDLTEGDPAGQSHPH